MNLMFLYKVKDEDLEANRKHIVYGASLYIFFYSHELPDLVFT